MIMVAVFHSFLAQTGAIMNINTHFTKQRLALMRPCKVASSCGSVKIKHERNENEVKDNIKSYD